MMHTPANNPERAAQWISVFGLLLFVGVWRFYQVRALALPAWVDSVHHTLLMRILLEQRGLPATWGPYLPDTPFYYHFGFHVSAALLAKLTGLTGTRLGEAVLIAGQLWQALLVLAVYLLARSLFITLNSQEKAHEQAFIAMLLVAFVSQMPAFYVGWGRYTLLAGVTLMAFSMAAASKRRWVALTICTALTAITHHYLLFLLALFLVLSWLLRQRERRPLVLSSVVAALLVSPWLWRVWHFGRQYFGVGAQPDGQQNVDGYILSLLGPLQNYALLLIAAVGFVLVIRRVWRDPAARSPWLPFCGWTLLLVGLLGPWQLRPFRADHAALILFLPAVIFAALALSQLRRPTWRWLAVMLLVGWGMVTTRNIVRPDTIIATADDVAAIEWIDARTPPDATFLIDVTPWFNLWRGADGGWWITPLTGRQTVLPPIAYGWSAPDVIQRYTQPAQALAALASAPAQRYCTQLEALMREGDAAYYYTRSPRPAGCGALQLIFSQQHGVHLYHLRQ